VTLGGDDYLLVGFDMRPGAYFRVYSIAYA